MEHNDAEYSAEYLLGFKLIVELYSGKKHAVVKGRLLLKRGPL